MHCKNVNQLVIHTLISGTSACFFAFEYFLEIVVRYTIYYLNRLGTSFFIFDLTCLPGII
jgi:hypothetical protein